VSVEGVDGSSFWTISRLGCGLPNDGLIFPGGTYYPQVHPQAVEKQPQQLTSFDRTSSHALHRSSI
jgi:hypothetical protein